MSDNILTLKFPHRSFLPPTPQKKASLVEPRSTPCVWDPGVKDALLCDLNNSRDTFDSVTNDLLAGRADINESINGISAIINKFTLMYCGKNINSCKSSVKRHKAASFNTKCKDSKKIYMESKKLYSENQTPDNKATVLTNRNAYNKVKRKAKKDYYENKTSKLTSMSNDSPRKFWKYVNNLKKKSKTNKDELNVNVFFEHFKRMSNSLRLEGYDVNESRENIDVNINISELDAPISVIEIMNTIKSLKWVAFSLKLRVFSNVWTIS